MSYWDDPLFEERVLGETPLIRLPEPPDLEAQLIEALKEPLTPLQVLSPAPSLVLVTDMGA